MSHAVQERAVSENYNPAASPYRGSLPALPGQGKQAGKDGIGRDTSGGAVDSVAMMFSH